MIYHKFKLSDGIEMKVELYEENLISYCVNCGDEMSISQEEIIQIWDQGGDSPSTAFQCSECVEQF